MHERDKIEEAKHFLSCMEAEEDNPLKFDFNLSAFINAARSVLQYAYEDAMVNKGKNWYDQKMANSSILRFFKDKRNTNIHKEPVKSNQITNVKKLDDLPISDDVFIDVKDNGVLTETYHIGRQSTIKTNEDILPEISTKYFFKDWHGSEDVITLCKKYLDEIEIFVAEGIASGFLSK